MTRMMILKLDSGIYFGLDQVGARIWKLIADGRTRHEVLQTITAEYETSRRTGGDVLKPRKRSSRKGRSTVTW